MKVVVTDYSFASIDVEEEILRPLGCEIVAWKERRPPSELASLVADADCVISQFASVNAEVVGAMQKARAIVRYGIGVDNVDLEAARAKGIPVCNVPDYCLDEVADQTLAFLLASTRNVVTNSLSVKAGEWRLAVPLDGMKALCDLTVGIVGCGRIGRQVIARLHPFKCKVVAFDPALSPAEINTLGAIPVSLDELLATSDVVSLHCPSTAKTRRMINRESLAKTKKGVILINVARGDLVDTNDLIEGLRSEHVGAAALDVFDPEPIPPASPLLTMPNVIVSAHIASTSVRAVKRLRESVATTAALAIQGKPVPNVVNGVGR